METLFPTHWTSRDVKKAWRSAAKCNNTWCWGFRHCRCCFVYFLYMRLFPLFLCSHYMWKHKRYTDTHTQIQGQKNSFMKKQFWRYRWFLVFSYSSDCFPFWLLFKRGSHSHADTTNHEYIQKESKRVVLIICTYKRRLKCEKTHGRMKITFWTFARLSVRVFIFATTSCFQR